MYCRSFIPILALCASCAVQAADILYSEDFEKFDLAKPPKDVAVAGGAEVTVVDDAQKGKVLCIKHAGGGYPGLSYTVDVNKARGGKLKFSVSAKCPGAYEPLADKPWARPKLILQAKINNGADQYSGGHLDGNKPEWVDINAEYTVGDDVTALTINLRVELVATEVFFDGFKIELEGGGKPAPSPTPGAAPATAAKADPKAPAAKPVDNTPAGKSPKKTFEDGGIIFGPDIAKALKKSVKPGATAQTVLLLGPGFPTKEKDLDNFKPAGKWQVMPSPKELTGTMATPVSLLAHLPAFLGKNKPEVVVFFGEVTGTRKPNDNERMDWEDLARVCKRMGAIPIFAVQAQGSQEELRKELMDAVIASLSPAIDLKAPSTVHKRLSIFLDLLDRHIFERTPLDAPVAGVTKQPDEE